MSDTTQVGLEQIPTSPFARHIGIALDSVGDERATASVSVAPDVMNAQGGLHGGVVATLIDFVSGNAAIFANGGTIRRRSTVSMTVQYLDGVKSGRVEAEAVVVRRGRSLSVCEVRVRDDRGKLVATALVTYRIDS
jgi:acyl-CoA thioesterase